MTWLPLAVVAALGGAYGLAWVARYLRARRERTPRRERLRAPYPIPPPGMSSGVQPPPTGEASRLSDLARFVVEREGGRRFVVTREPTPHDEAVALWLRSERSAFERAQADPLGSETLPPVVERKPTDFEQWARDLDEEIDK